MRSDTAPPPHLNERVIHFLLRWAEFTLHWSGKRQTYRSLTFATSESNRVREMSAETCSWNAFFSYVILLGVKERESFRAESENHHKFSLLTLRLHSWNKVHKLICDQLACCTVENNSLYLTVFHVGDFSPPSPPTAPPSPVSLLRVFICWVWRVWQLRLRHRDMFDSTRRGGPALPVHLLPEGPGFRMFVLSSRSWSWGGPLYLDCRM